MLKFLKKIKRQFSIYLKHKKPDFNKEFDFPIYEWKTHTYHRHERGKFWIFNMLAFFIFMLIYAIYSSSISMVIATISLGTIYYIAHREPEHYLHVKLSKHGIKVSSKIYPYEEIKSFSIIYEPPYVKTLNLFLQRKHNSELIIELGEADYQMIKEILREHLPEAKKKDESLINIFARAFKI